MKTYVINMEKDVQKRMLIEQQLVKQANLEIVFFKAIEGRKLNREELRNSVNMDLFKKRYHDFATLPAIGCSLSHWSLYCMMSEAADPYALILEDDALLSPNLACKIGNFESFLCSDTPTVILLTPEFVYGLKQEVKATDGLSLYALCGGTMASGYLINKAGAELLEKNLYPISYLADMWDDFVEMGLKVYGIVPHLVSYPEGLGEIGRSQHDSVEKGLYQKIRYRLAFMKGKVWVFLFVYMKGLRISSKKW